jgi:HK97 gp10 family phage protein
MLKIGEDNIKAETPVLTGNLKTSNRTEQDGDTGYFINDADYASYVEYGTYKQSPNPFMRRGITKSIPEFAKIIVEELKI